MTLDEAREHVRQLREKAALATEAIQAICETMDLHRAMTAMARSWNRAADTIELLCEMVEKAQQDLRDECESNTLLSLQHALLVRQHAELANRNVELADQNAELANRNVELSREAWAHHETLSARIRDIEDELEAYHTAAPVP